MAKNPEDFAPRQQPAIKAEAMTSANYRHNPADPLVVVSTMQFGFTVPLWDAEGKIAGAVRDGAPAFDIRTEIGLTVLSAVTSAFALFGVPVNSYAPPVKDEDKVWIHMTMGRPERLKMPPFVDETGKEKVGDIEGLFLRALETAGYGHGGGFNPMEPDRSRFLVGPGRTHPEVMVMRASSLWADGKEGNDARAILLDVTRYAKSEAHVGALHDMALLAGSVGSPIVDACRRRAAHAGWRK